MMRKKVLSYLVALLCLSASHLSAQITEQCSANAGGADTICYNDPFILLSAPSNIAYNVPPNVGWTAIQAPPGVSLNDLNITDPSELESKVMYGPGGNWTPGAYSFEFCADCFDANGDGIVYRACDTVTHVVTPEVTTPVITNLDGTAPATLVVECTIASFLATKPGPGEYGSVSVTPVDGLIETSFNPVTGELTIVRLNLESTNQGNCNYEVVYTLSNGGCVASDTVAVRFISPRDADGDGIIKGFVLNGCPTCNNILTLRGHRPGCGATGHWAVIDGPQGYTANFSNINLANGAATVTVSPSGVYTFTYTVGNNEPCPPSIDTVVCTVLDIGGGIFLGPDQVVRICDESLPAGTYSFTFNEIPNALYKWTYSGPVNLTITNPSGHASDVVFPTPVNLIANPYLTIFVYAYKYFIDPDCEGPLQFQEVVLPYNDSELNWAYIDSLQQSGACLEYCQDIALIKFAGAPQIEIEQDTIDILCSQGSEFVLLTDYFDLITNANNVQTTVNILQQPASSNLSNPISYFSFIHLNGVGDYVFEINATWVDNSVTPPFTCEVVDTLLIRIREAQPVNAGTDQTVCYNEPIRLNGNDPYQGEIQGTWTQVNCAPNCTVTLVDPHNPNTQVLLSGVDVENDLPMTLYFEWSFNNEESTCNLSDIVAVTLQPCITPCDSLNLYVESVCEEGMITFTARNANGTMVDPYVYLVIWNVDGQEYTHTNPLSISDPGAQVNYTLTVILVVEGDIAICLNDVSGTAAGCDTTATPIGCGVYIIESCDPCGNVVVTAVDENGVPIVPTTYLHTFRWWVYGGPDDTGGGVVYNQVNPITIHHNACYALLYERYYYPPNAPWQVPGMHDSICKINLPRTCVSIECPGICSDFPTFLIAAPGDDLDLALNLPFPQGSNNICNLHGAQPTLGLFLNNQPVDTSLYNVQWKNGASGPYVTGQFQHINEVKVTSLDGCCIWEDRYVPNCLCTNLPTNLMCKQQIVKYCASDGTVTYNYQQPELAWYTVPGATGYELAFSLDNLQECCSSPPYTAPFILSVNSTPWEIPYGWDCFTVRIRAINPYGVCTETDWSEPYTYCAATANCETYITTCGCCNGSTGGEYAHLPSIIIPESEVLALLAEAPESQIRVVSASEEEIPAAFSIFPNPTENRLFIQPERILEGGYSFQIFDLLQKPVMGGQISGNQTSEIDLGALPAGVYILRIRDENNSDQQVNKIFVAK